MAKKKTTEETVEESPQEEIDEQPADEIGIGAAGEPGEEQEDLLAELEKMRQENRELQDRMLRMAADFENMKKRVQREKELSLKYAEENLLRDILPAVDNLQRALAQDQNSEDFGANLLEGVELTLKGMLNTLEKFGLAPIESVGQPFDPNFHEAMVMEPSKEVPDQNVIAEYEKGYMYKDRLLRASKVVVSKGDVVE